MAFGSRIACHPFAGITQRSGPILVGMGQSDGAAVTFLLLPSQRMIDIIRVHAIQRTYRLFIYSCSENDHGAINSECSVSIKFNGDQKTNKTMPLPPSDENGFTQLVLIDRTIIFVHQIEYLHSLKRHIWFLKILSYSIPASGIFSSVLLSLRLN